MTPPYMSTPAAHESRVTTALRDVRNALPVGVELKTEIVEMTGVVKVLVRWQFNPWPWVLVFGVGAMIGWMVAL